MAIPTLSIIIPVYNEARTLPEVIQRVLKVPVDKEVLVVDDGSTDGTKAFLNHVPDTRVTVLRHEKNQGKGAAIRTALSQVKGKLVIVQDGDLEYDPMDYLEMIRAMNGGNGVVYGSRNLSRTNGRSYMRFWLGGVFLSRMANGLFGLRLSDLTTCYKLFPSDLLRSLGLQCPGFEFCAEVTAKLGKQKVSIREVPISYYPRKFQDGKKIRWIDGLKAVWTLLKYRFVE